MSVDPEAVEATASVAAAVTAADPSASPRGHERRRLARFVARRVLTGILTLFVASILIFAATDLLPGSPASNALGKFATKPQIAALDRKLGYDHPLPVRYLNWLGGVVHGDLGDSAIGIAQGSASAPIWPLIRDRLFNTLTLAITTAILLVPISLLLGAWAALRVNRPADHAISTTTLALIALPEFVVGTLLILLFFTVLHWLQPVSLIPPGSPAVAHPNLLVLPVLTLLATSVAWTTRLVRAGMVEVLDSDFVQTARLQGLREPLVVRRYAMRNALAPSVQVFAVSIQALFGGVIVTEVVFSYPGLGKELVDAVLIHDTPLVQSIALLIATFYILVNVVADIVVVLLIPKLRTQV
ncbi:MAG TPA: ABC transporter permease [Gaiellaceae bacterium]